MRFLKVPFLAFCSATIPIALPSSVRADSFPVVMLTGSASAGDGSYDAQDDAAQGVIEIAADRWPLLGIGVDTYGLLNDPGIRSQSDERRFKLTGLLSDSLSYAGGDAFWAESLGAFGTLRNTLRDADLRAAAYGHDEEARGLAFGGALSRANLPAIGFAASDFGHFGGSFHTLDTGGRISIAGSWTAAIGNTSDHFNATSRYTFDQLQTVSGHVLTGVGSVARERIEQHGLFAHEPFLNWTGALDLNSPTGLIETTRRHETYSESYNGALANQAIRRSSGLDPVSISGHAASSVPPPSSRDLLEGPSVAATAQSPLGRNRNGVEFDVRPISAGATKYNLAARILAGRPNRSSSTWQVK